MRSFSDADRRARLVARQHLGGTAATVQDAVTGLLVLHATDPATVFLSVLARCRTATVVDVSRAMYEQRTLLRMLAMRRTLFVVPRDLAAVVHHGAALEVAARIRRRLLSQLATLPTEPQLPEDLGRWLREVEAGTEVALARLGSATGAQLSAAEPRLRTALLPTTDKAWDVRRSITTQVLTLMGAEGRMVRDQPRGEWQSRQHTWRPVTAWWPDGLPDLSPAEARRDLVAAYLRQFGPATEADVTWWTGWNRRQTTAALAALELEQVGLSAGPGLVLAGDTDPPGRGDPAAALLPALDATPMGWKQREWFSPDDVRPLYDRNGNIGPTLWWHGEIIGGWAVRPDGTIATRLLVDRGAEAVRAVAAEAGRLTGLLGGTPVVPTFPTPLERQLRTA